MTPANGLNEKVGALAKRIDATVDSLIENAQTFEEIEALNLYRSELHALLMKRALGQALKGYGDLT